MSWETDQNATDVSVVGLQKGTNQTGVRMYNERLVLSLIRTHGSLPKAEIARLTGLSAQTISIIVRQLDADGLLVEQERVRGRIGQPSVPYALNPDGAFTFGLYIGRRSAGLVLLDFLGSVRTTLRKTYTYPTPDGVLNFVENGVTDLTQRLPEGLRSRIAGLGVATPFQMWNWAYEVGAPANVLEDWRTFDMAAEISSMVGLPVTLMNDGTSACAAELLFGAHHAPDFLYFYIGSFVGGGIVMNGGLVPGRFGYAAALGSLPVPASYGETKWHQLINEASIHLLEKRLVAAGRDPQLLWSVPQNWDEVGPMLDEWIDMAAHGLAHAIVSAISIYDFPLAIIDGGFPADVRKRLVERVQAVLTQFDFQGLWPVSVVEGSLGADSRGMGAAAQPLIASFARDREVLFKEAT